MILDAAFTIATVPLEGGARIGISRLPGLFGDLESDVTAIVEWRPRLVVSTTEHAEMQQWGSQDLCAAIGNACIDWVHLPIRDYGGPEGSSRDAWPKLAVRLHEI